MQLSYQNQSVEFRPWKPARGQVFRGLVAFDTETTLIDRDRPALIPHYVLGAAWDGRQGIFITREHLPAFFEFHAGCEFIFHNAAFDLKVIDNRLRQVGSTCDPYDLVDANRVWDTWLLHKLLRLATAGDTANGTGEATLEHCATTYLGLELPKDTVDSQGRPVRTSYGQWLNRPAADIDEVYLEYLARDVLATFDVYHELRQRLQEALAGQEAADAFGYVSADWLEQQQLRWGPQTHHIQLRAAIVLDQISRNGLYLDRSRRDGLVQTLDEAIREQLRVLKEFGYLPGEGSDKQLQGLLGKLRRQRPDIPLPTTATGKFSTSREALEPFREDDEFIATYLTYKDLEKLRSTFLSKMTGDRIHPSFQPLVRTGRTSSFGAINAQNLPRDDRVRSCFSASPGHVLVAADYTAIEMVTLAQACKGQFSLESPLAAALNAGADPHKLLAAAITGKAAEEVTKEERQQAKAINFGKPGGMGDAALRQYARQTYGVDFSGDQIKGLTDYYFETYPEVKAFLKDYEVRGEASAKELNLTVGEYEQWTGRYWSRYESDRSRPEAMLVNMCLKLLRESRPTTWTGREYTPEEQDYFWTKLAEHGHLFPEDVQREIRRREASESLSSRVRSLLDRRGVFTLTGRLRANASYTARHNTVFQGLAADGAKLALWNLFRAGFRVVNFIHDEVLIEVHEGCDLSLESEKIERLMIAGMRAVVPDVQVKAERAVMKNWSKDSANHLPLPVSGREQVEVIVAGDASPARPQHSSPTEWPLAVCTA